ncbi:MAG: Flp pilus assembly complex ATPase component TadA [Parcubacteria group bacterium]|nr:Flp pilus assembly complex ATPase component TadA [Parcubacteria group bacterium]
MPTQQPSSSSADILHFEKWLEMVGERKATDVHLTVGNVPMLRVDGAIVPLLDEDVVTGETLERIIGYLLSEDELSRLSRERELLVGRTLKKVMRFRLHAFYSRGYPALSLRHLPAEEATIESLGLPDIISELVGAEQGLAIIAGPFDSGKTTTMRSILSALNHTQSRYIVTIEEPVEYVLPSDKSVVVQREVGRDVPTFEAGLATLHEEDADVVAVGALANAEAAEHTLRLANAGKLVIAASEGRHALSVLLGIRDFFSPAEQARIFSLLADCLLGVVVQLLLPKTGGGRVLVTEVLRATNPVKSLIREGKLAQIPAVMQTSGALGMATMDRSLAEAVKLGTISIETGRKYAIDANQFAILVSR